jgi:hypothetical protein
MKIGIIGSGIVGRVLASAFLKEGNSVMLGTRNLAKEEVITWKNENHGGHAGNFEETAKFGELLVLATSGKGGGRSDQPGRARKFFRQNCNRHNEPHCGCAPGEWGAAILYSYEQLIDGKNTGTPSRSKCCKSVQ